jgi:polyferredoxin
MASTSLWLWPYRGDLQAVTAVCGVLIVFHIGLCGSLLIAGGANLGAAVTHGTMGVLFLVAFLRRNRWCSAVTG